MKQLRIKEEGPVVLNSSFVDKSYLYFLADMMNISDSNDVLEVLKRMFLEFGYTDSDIITVRGVPKSAWDMVRVVFGVNGKNNFDIKFHRRYGRDVLGVSLTDSKGDNYSYQCRVSENNGEFDTDLYLKGYHIGKDKNLIICERGYDGVRYSFFSCDDATQGNFKQQLTLNVDCSVEESRDNRTNGVYYTPKNESTLVNYLSNISYPVDLCSVYNGVCDIAFEDVSSLENFELNVVTENKTKDFHEREVTDVIHLQRGELKRFGLLHADKVLDCSLDNKGYSVTFLGNGYMEYRGLIPKGGFSSRCVEYIDVGTDDVSYSCVSEVADKMIGMFPVDSEKILKGKYKKDDDSLCEQISMFDHEKVFVKKD